MNKEKQKIVPERRFPGFVNDEDWIEKHLKDIADIVTGTTPKTSKPENYGGNKLFVSPADISGERYISKTNKTLSEIGFSKSRVIPVDSILFVCIGSTIGKIVQNRIECATNQQINSLIPFENHSNDFIYSLLENNSSKIAILASNQAVPMINKTDFSEILVWIPKTKQEQEKIANCLSSLDEVINLENEKLELLRGHKKGLLQHLFPAKGENQPKFRFSEFKDNGDWTISSLNKISASIFDGTHQTPKYTDKGIPFFSVENIVSGRKNKFISREDYLYETRNNKPEFEDVLITRIGNIGTPKVVDWEYEFSIYVTLAVVKKSEKFDSYYLQAYIQSSRFQNEIRRRSLLKAAPCKINMDELRKCEVLLPTDKKEQQKIAKCILSAHDLIESQTKKITALKKHKKGLMQQLFPNVNSL